MRFVTEHAHTRRKKEAKEETTTQLATESEN